MANEAIFVVTLSPAPIEPVTVNYATRAGTAVAGTDFTARSGELTFAAGETSKTVAVPVTLATEATGKQFHLDVSWPPDTANTVQRGSGACALPTPAQEPPPVEEPPPDEEPPAVVAPTALWTGGYWGTWLNPSVPYNLSATSGSMDLVVSDYATTDAWQELTGAYEAQGSSLRGIPNSVRSVSQASASFHTIRVQAYEVTGDFTLSWTSRIVGESVTGEISQVLSLVASTDVLPETIPQWGFTHSDITDDNWFLTFGQRTQAVTSGSPDQELWVTATTLNNPTWTTQTTPHVATSNEIAVRVTRVGNTLTVYCNDVLFLTNSDDRYLAANRFIVFHGHDLYVYEGQNTINAEIASSITNQTWG